MPHRERRNILALYSFLMGNVPEHRAAVRVAAAVSRAGRPELTVPLGLAAVGLVAGGWVWAGLSLVLAAGLPVGLVLGMKASGAVESTRVARHGTRKVLLGVMVAMEIGVAVGYAVLGAPAELVVAQVAMTAGLAAVALLTLVELVSVHCAVLGSVVPTAVTATALVALGHV
jgi:hypothetical protein